MYYNLGLTKRKGLSNKNPSTAICKGGKSQLPDLFSQPYIIIIGGIIIKKIYV